MAASRLTFREVHATGIYIMERPSGREAPAGVAALEAWSPMTLLRPLKKKLELKDRENRVFEHDSTFFTFRLNNRFSESYFYR